MIQKLSTDHYRSEPGREYYRIFQQVSENVYRWISRNRAKKLMPHITDRDVVLEYGIGSGWNMAGLNCAHKMGFDINAHVEPDVTAHGIEFIKDTASISRDSVDVIIRHHVLEHVPSPFDTLIELRRMLKPDGTLLLFVPYEIKRCNRRYIVGEPNHHIFSWTPQTIGNLVNDCQFDVQTVRLASYGYDRAAAVRADKYNFGEMGYRSLKMLASVVVPIKEIRLVAKPETKASS